MYIATRRNRRGDVRYYWYKSVRRGKTVTGEYVRPASDLEVEEHFRESRTRVRYISEDQRNNVRYKNRVSKFGVGKPMEGK